MVKIDDLGIRGENQKRTAAEKAVFQGQSVLLFDNGSVYGFNGFALRRRENRRQSNQP